jgi:hypothetical protein
VSATRDGIMNCTAIPMLATQTQTRLSANSMFSIVCVPPPARNWYSTYGRRGLSSAAPR